MSEAEAMERSADVPGLIAALAAANGALRAEAAAALGRLKAEQALEPLTQALGDPWFYDPTEGQENAAQLREWASEEVYPVREAAQLALQQILTGKREQMPDPYTMKAEQDVPGLTAASRYGRDEETSRLWARIDDARLAPLIIELDQKAARCREGAVRGLWVLEAAVGDERAIDGLRDALVDPCSYVRKAAVFALAALAGRGAVEPLCAVLEDEDQRVREDTAMELGRLGDPAAVGPLTSALQDWVPAVRKQAVRALGMIGGKQAIEALTVALQDSDEGVREQAQEALDRGRS